MKPSLFTFILPNTTMKLPFGYFELILALICYFSFFFYRQRHAALYDWPLLGMLPAFTRGAGKVHERCTEIFRQTGGTFLFKGPWFVHMDMLATVNPYDVHHIMSSNFLNFPKGNEFREIFEVLGDGIFNSDNELWRSHRKVTNALINNQKFFRFLARMNTEKLTNGLVPVLNNVASRGVVVDMQDVFQRLTFDTTCMFVTGYDPGCLSVDFKDVPFSRAMDEAEEAIFVRHVLPKGVWKLQRWLGVGKEKKLKKAWETLDDVIYGLIARKRRDLSDGVMSKNEAMGVDILTSLLTEKQTYSDGFKQDDKFLRDAILNIMIAGRDTTSSSLTWFLWLVMSHPDVERKIRDEINTIIPEYELGKPRIFEAEETNKLIYMHAAFCEALRLYPPVPFQHKGPVKPDVLPSGYRVDPNTKIMFSLYAMGRMETIWGDDSVEFKPERWITENHTIRHEPSYKFLSFNAGPRTCIGKQVAFNQMKAVGATILHNYNFKMVKGHVVAPNVSIILYMKHGLKVKVAPRWT
ncbi:putative cytochrome P450 [Helianthus annuus]|uniref:Cytochrome P450 n=2 Tax=Helianthus annuus TaxID=4232 RepID=A0A251SBZ2_HELAN|nr:putative cytochrome P450 [Helianthus annuus]KAJ0453092.1 putative cytochrome P450 [Helianthus annuus]KAJ0475004.1 putative cytochrome P450 [Helianthus annuus]KAJ0650559.1 putative cytochrome P450 [Helianthus annuus]KAJ0654312.1 putative cytochrome P450 [Helianthus annuus]